MGNVLIYFRISFFPLLWVCILASAAESASGVSGSYDRGRALFDQKCAPCHAIGGGKKIGPDLSGVTQRRDRDWLVRWIYNPEEMIASGDATAKEVVKGYAIRMPSAGLSKEEIADVLSYLESQKPNINLSTPADLKKETRGEIYFSTRTYLQFYEDSRGNRYGPLYERVDLEMQDRSRKCSFRSSGLVRYDVRTLSGEKREMDELTYAFLTCAPFSDHGPVFKIGRYYVFDGVASDQIDGIHSLWEITPATGFSVYGGRPVETEFDGKRGDYVYGGRVYQRIEKTAEVGASFLKEDNDGGRFREELGLDVWLLPMKSLELQGHSFWNNITRGWMEHSYTIRVPLQRAIISGLFGQSTYSNAFSARTLSAFSPDLLGQDEGLTKLGASAELPLGRGVSTIINYTGYGYKKSGDARYYGTTVATGSTLISAGISLHRMDGEVERLRYLELRAYVKKSFRKMSFVIDAIDLHYDLPISGLKNAYSVSGTATYKIDNSFSAGTDVVYSKNPDFTHNTMVLLKLVYNFRKDL
jgi:cytochrome c2